MALASVRVTGLKRQERLSAKALFPKDPTKPLSSSSTSIPSSQRHFKGKIQWQLKQWLPGSRSGK